MISLRHYIYIIYNIMAVPVPIPQQILALRVKTAETPSCQTHFYGKIYISSWLHLSERRRKNWEIPFLFPFLDTQQFQFPTDMK